MPPVRCILVALFALVLTACPGNRTPPPPPPNVDLAALTLERDWHVRLIELMPLGGGECARLALSQYVPNSETRGRIEAELGSLQELPARDRADESRTRDDGGSGLGLAIAKSIVEMHKGRIWAESEKGKGLRVVIELPAE